MAEEIKRTGPPRATDLKGEEYTWMVPINTLPSKEWTRMFSEPKETSVLCNPKRVGIMQQALVFKAEENAVPAWIQHIDKWIQDANGALAAQEQADRQRRLEQERQEQERQRRIAEVTEKFKSL